MNNLCNFTPKFVLISKRCMLPIRKGIYPRCYSTEPAVKTCDENERNKELQKEFEKISSMFIAKRSKKPQKPPFLKNIFLGKFDTDMLTYPELLKEDYEILNKNLESTQEYFKNLGSLPQSLDTKSDFMENLRRLNLFGLQGPQTLNARELNVTESCRFNDILSSNSGAMMGLLCNDKLVFESILKHGTEEQRKKYLPGLISGKNVGAFCVTESVNMKEGVFNTTAIATDDKKNWVINGEKSCVVNGSTANLLLVLAKTIYKPKLKESEMGLTLFLVEKDFGGVTTEVCEPIGVQATDFANIKLNNTHVPAANILGEVNLAHKLLPSILTEFRLGTGTASAGILRKLIDKTVKYCTQTSVENRSLAETEYVQSLIAKLTVSLYAMESITYLTSFLMDQYENQDCQMEAIVVKIFSSQQTVYSTLSIMEMIGPSAYMSDHWCNILHRDALSHLMLHEPSENLKLTLSLYGLQHTGKNIQEKVKMVRNPLFFPGFAFKRLWKLRKQHDDNPSLTLNLPEYLHPSLTNAAQRLEYCVLRVEYAVECLLVRSSSEVINKHMELTRLAECIIDIYVMTACLGRASRSYCIGVRHANIELTLAHAYCVSAHARIQDKLGKICKGPYSANDEQYRTIAENVFKVGHYFPEHPLTRNY